MEQKQKMRIKNIILYLLVLVLIWILCNSVQNRLDQIHQNQLINRLGKRWIDQTIINLAKQIKNNNLFKDENSIKQQIDDYFNNKYNLETIQQEEHICLVLTNFHNYYQSTYLEQTISSIQYQNYSQYSILYLFNKQNQHIDITKQFISNLSTKNTFKNKTNQFLQYDQPKIADLYKIGNKCPQKSILVFMQIGQVFISSNIFRLINYQFNPQMIFTNTNKSINQLQLLWSSSMYKNDKIGFSFDYNQQIKSNKSFRKYPSSINDLIAFKNTFLWKIRSSIHKCYMSYPLSITQSYTWLLLQKSNNYKYLPQILSTKPRNYILRSNISQFDKKSQQLIRSSNCY